MEKRTVLVSGAGVAGPALAFWLTRYGFTTTVVERAPTLRSGGHAIDIRGAAREVAERMDVMAEIKQARVDWRGMSYIDDTGKRRASLPAELVGMRGELAQIEIQRGDLVRIFHAASQEGVEYIFDDSITALSQDDEGVKVTFANSSPRVFDLVVGADGSRSRVRALAFGAESEFTREYGSYTAFFSIPQRFDLDGWELFYNVPGRRMAALRPGLQGINTKVLLSFAASGLRYDGGDIEQQKKIVAREFAGVGWEVPKPLDAIESAQDFSFSATAKVTLDSWSRGRTVLLGDSAWASFAGHGTSFAVIGAYLLAGELKAADGDHRIAFARYEDQLRHYVELGQQGPPGGEKMFLPKTKWGIWLRNQSIRVLPHMPWKGLIAKGSD
jgi:2-polyprenyl-6-methoxyphenol hydroxylase-like FAD-dependent oxidoreductase